MMTNEQLAELLESLYKLCHDETNGRWKAELLVTMHNNLPIIIKALRNSN